MTARAGIVVTGTEVLSGIIADRNGPWLSERLRTRGVDLAHVMIVGDRPADLRAALDFLAAEGMDLVITSGGLGPTADDLTAEIVADFAGLRMELDEALEGRIAVILERLRARWRGGIDEEAMRAGNRKQAMVPVGRRGARAGRHRPGPRRARRAGDRRAPGPARRAADRCGRRRWRPAP